MRWWHSVKAHVHCFRCGLGDAFSFTNIFVFFFTNKTIRVRSCQCTLLNGGVFVTSILVGEYLLRPLLLTLLSSFSTRLLLWLYTIFWLYPLYIIALTLNSVWYHDIAVQAKRYAAPSTSTNATSTIAHSPVSSSGNSHSAKKGVPREPRSASLATTSSWHQWLLTLANEFYRVMLITVLCVQIALLSLIPYVGQLLAFLHWCWLYAFYAFDYTTVMQDVPVEQRLDWFERHWSYFAGFGLPAAAITVFIPGWIATGLASLAFPILILVAIVAEPLSVQSAWQLVDHSHRNASSGRTDAILSRLPLFFCAKTCSYCILLVVQRLRGNQNGSRTRATAVEERLYS